MPVVQMTHASEGVKQITIYAHKVRDYIFQYQIIRDSNWDVKTLPNAADFTLKG